MRHKQFFQILGVVALAALAYWPSFRAPFQFDDYFVIVTNPVIPGLGQLSVIWNFDPSRFLTYLFFAVNYRWGGLEPQGYHVINFCLHLLATSLVYVLVKRLLFHDEGTEGKKRCALFAALVFLVHPVQTSAVTYVAQRSTLLATIFYLAAVFFYVRYRQKERFRDYFSALLAATFGVFCKPIIVTLPLALLLYEKNVSSSGARWPMRLFMILPFLLIVLTVPALLFILQYQHFSINQILDVSRETTAITRGEYLLTQFHVIWTYLGLMFLPLSQNIDYDYPVIRSLFIPSTLIAIAGLLALLALAVRLWQKQRLLGFGIFWFLITLSLESSFFPISDVIFEHRLYLPMFGFALFLGYFFTRLRPTHLRKLFVVAILIFFSCLTFQRNQVWSDRIGFLRDAVTKSPRKARVYNSLAVAYAEEGQYGMALSTLQQAVALDPTDMTAYNNRANIYRVTGQYDLAIEEYSFILRHAPDFAFVYNFRSQCFAAQGKKDQALADALKARTLGFPVGEEFLSGLQNNP